MVLKDFAKVLALMILFFLLMTFYKGEAPEPAAPSPAAIEAVTTGIEPAAPGEE